MFEDDANADETIVIPFDSGLKVRGTYRRVDGTDVQISRPIGYDSIAGVKARLGKHLILKNLVCLRGHVKRN